MAVKAFNTGKFVEKVLSLSAYDNTLITDLYINPINKEKINRGAAFILKNYFSEYLDARARQNPSAYHHVYEFDQVGNKESRLFKAKVTSTPNGAIITFNFTEAKNVNRQGHPFPLKAEVMEKGDPLIIKAKRGKYLKFTLEDGTFITTTESFVRDPGGREVQGSFETTFNNFMSNQGIQTLQKFGFFKMIEQGIIQKRRLVVPRINSGIVADAIRAAKKDAGQIAGGVSSYYV
jgi:hypothetical protein